ncbi:MAG: CsbD family protein [Rhodobacteraceae bacterium]|nr:CsbD family protein [Paracoccaceae bacterium]
MNWDQIEGKWKEMTGNVQQRWGKLTDDDLAMVKGDRRELAGKIQTAYGVSKEEADKQIDDWMVETR